MATTRKALTRAKAEHAADALHTVLAGTDHDPRLTTRDREAIHRVRDRLLHLTNQLRRDERYGRAA